jgi:hypothetical protein
MFEALFESGFARHRYTLSSTGMKTKDYVFCSRQLAEQKMYEILEKYGLHIIEVWDDHHFKTYLLDNGARFYINRI